MSIIEDLVIASRTCAEHGVIDAYGHVSVRSDRDRIMAAGFNMDYRELPGTHDGSSDDWALFLIPHMAGWNAP